MAVALRRGGWFGLNLATGRRRGEGRRVIRRLELRNFMSHKHSVLEFSDGLTVLVGENNCGKSAVVSALQVLSQNISGDFMVRHGEKECSVTVETDDGHVLEWRRRGKTVSYVIDGTEVHRLRRRVPENLQTHLRLPVVEAEGEAFDVHFGEQKRPVFLLDEASSRRAAFFASSSDSARLIEIQSLHRQKVREARAEERVLLARADLLERRLESLQPLGEITAALERVESLYREQEDGRGCILRLSDLGRRYRNAVVAAAAWERKTASLAGLEAPPVLAPTPRLRGCISQLAERVAAIPRMGAVAAAANPLSAPPELGDTGRLRRLCLQLAQVQRGRSVHRALARLLAAAPAPAMFDETARLRERIFGLGERLGRRRRAERRSQILQRIAGPPQLGDTGRAAGLIRQLRETRRGVAAFQKAVRDAREREALMEREIRTTALEIEACPTCGQRIDPERLMAAVAVAAPTAAPTAPHRPAGGELDFSEQP